MAEGDPASGFKGKLIVGKRAVRCLFVSEASYLTAGQISAFCDRRIGNDLLGLRQRRAAFRRQKSACSGGALEDPAIGVAAAAFAGYLRDLDLAARRCD